MPKKSAESIPIQISIYITKEANKEVVEGNHTKMRKESSRVFKKMPNKFQKIAEEFRISLGKKSPNEIVKEFRKELPKKNPKKLPKFEIFKRIS